MRHSFIIYALVVSCSLAMFGCSSEENPAEQRARDIFGKAKQALLRRDHQESKRLLREAVLLYEHLDDEQRLAETSMLLGETYSAGAEFDSAFALFTRSRELYRRGSDKAGIRATVLAIAETHRVRGENQQAFAILMEELRLEEALGDVYGVQQLKWALIPICRTLADGEAEQRLINELLGDYTASHETAMLARVHFGLGKSSFHRLDYVEAAKSFAVALPLAKQAKDTILTIQTYLGLAITYDRLGNQTEAFQMFTEGIRLTDVTRGAERLREEMLLRVGNIYLRQQQYDRANKFLNTALRSAIKTQNKLLEAYALMQLGHCLNETGDTEALRHYNAGANLFSYIGLPWANAYAQTCLGAYAQKNGRLNAALEYFRAAVAGFDSSLVQRDDDLFVDCENTIYQSQQISPYDALIDLLFQLGKTDEAFLVAAKKINNSHFRALNLFDIETRNDRLNTALQAYAYVRGTRLGAEQRLAKALTMRAESRTLALDIQRSLMQSSGRMHQLGDSIALTNRQFATALRQAGVERSDAQRLVPEGSALVVYVPTKRSLYTFVITKSTAAIHVSAIEKPTLRWLMAAYIDALRRANDEAEPNALLTAQWRVRAHSFRLHSVLVRPIESSVQGASRLLVVPSPDLPIIPLHALQQEGRFGEYAIQRYTFRYLPDAEALALQGMGTNSYPVVVGFGNQGRTTVQVEYEVRDAKAFYKDAKLYFDRDATLARLQHESGDILHAAFEIQYRPEQPGNSFFVLSDGTGYTSAHYHRFGKLFSTAPFSTVMISNLSNTPLHSIVPRIFLMNGSANVVANGYMPARKAKKFFNEIFYTNLLTGASTEAAYRNALLEMIREKEYAEANVWAGFLLW